MKERPSVDIQMERIVSVCGRVLAKSWDGQKHQIFGMKELANLAEGMNTDAAIMTNLNFVHENIFLLIFELPTYTTKRRKK